MSVLSSKGSLRVAIAATVAVVSLGLSACFRIGPDFALPDAEVTESWSDGADESVSQAATDVASWWRAFEDPTLDGLIDLATLENLDLRIAGVRVLEARARLGIAVGNLYPQNQRLIADAEWASASESVANTAAADLDFSTYGVGLGAAWELDLWGRFRRGVESADAALLASVADYDDVLVSLAAEVGRTYVAIREIEERLAIAVDNVAAQRRSMEIADVRWRNGVTTELDMQRVRALLYDTESTVPALEAALRQAENALATLLGMPPGRARALLGETSTVPSAPAQVVIGLPAELLRRRPDIRRAEAEAAAQSARIGIAKADMLPMFTLFGTVGFSASDSTDSTRSGKAGLAELFDGNSLEIVGGPSVSWNIFNYGRIRNAVRVEDARLQQLLIAYERAVLRAQREVEDSLIGFLKGRIQVELLTISVDAAKRSRDLALHQYRDGRADYTSVIDALTFLLQEEGRLSQARGRVANDLIGVYAALGGGWQLREGRPLVPASVVEQMRERTGWGSLLDEGGAAAPEAANGDTVRAPDF